MYIQDRFGSYRSIEWTKTDWNCTRYSIITCFAQTSDSLARLTQTLARMPDVVHMRERNIKMFENQHPNSAQLDSTLGMHKKCPKNFAYDVGNVAERDKKRGPPTYVQNVMYSCALQHASQIFMIRYNNFRLQDVTFSRMHTDMESFAKWFLNESNGNGPSQSLLNEVETDQPRQEPDEIMDINPDSESKFGESNGQETLEWLGKFSNAT
ncbi:hypothetical protein TNCV_2159931 [Trichonephila clavipes]|nr:hypothetical protein TNCV_2159931 [Trichonephila clavipes]